MLLEVAINNFADITNQYVFSWFGADFTLFAIVCLIIIVALSYLFRLPYHLSLAIVYMFDLLGGGQSVTPTILLSIGLAILIIKGVGLCERMEYWKGILILRFERFFLEEDKSRAMIRLNGYALFK